MTDSGIVVSTHDDLAHVEVGCLDACGHCGARALCTGQESDKKLLHVKNPLRAHPGDRVAVDIPESSYSQALIKLFGTLLLASLLGMAAGYLVSPHVRMGLSSSSLAGLLVGLVLGVLFIMRTFRKKHGEALYPVISAIIEKGGCHGPA